MKRKIGWLLLLVCCLALMACGSAGDSKGSQGASGSAQVSDNSENSKTDASADAGDDSAATLTDATGKQIALTKTEDFAIGGTYVCAADDSVWAFGGDHLALAYKDDDGNLGSYICELSFYQTEADENGDVHLCVVVNNQNQDETSYWYVTNLVDDNDNPVGLKLEMPGDSEQYVQLTVKDDEASDSADQNQ